jgi:hypothetical protein
MGAMIAAVSDTKLGGLYGSPNLYQAPFSMILRVIMGFNLEFGIT